MLLIIGKVVLGNLEEENFLVPGNSIGLRLPLDSLQNFKKTREIVVDRSLFEDLPALDDYDEKVKKRYGTISKLFQAAKEFYPKKEKQKKNEEKDETLFEVDTYYGNVYRGT
jgi:hypothetical protein